MSTGRYQGFHPDFPKQPYSQNLQQPPLQWRCGTRPIWTCGSLPAQHGFLLLHLLITRWKSIDHLPFTRKPVITLQFCPWGRGALSWWPFGRLTIFWASFLPFMGIMQTTKCKKPSHSAFLPCKVETLSCSHVSLTVTANMHNTLCFGNMVDYLTALLDVSLTHLETCPLTWTEPLWMNEETTVLPGLIQNR